MSARTVPNLGWGISHGITETAYDMLDQAPTLSSDELAWWFGLSADQADMLRAAWRRDVKHHTAEMQVAA